MKKKQQQAKDAEAARLKGSQSAASEVRVRVLNGGGPPDGAAQETLTWLQNTEGVLKSENGGNAPEKIDKTTLEYSPPTRPPRRPASSPRSWGWRVPR